MLLISPQPFSERLCSLQMELMVGSVIQTRYTSASQFREMLKKYRFLTRKTLKTRCIVFLYLSLAVLLREHPESVKQIQVECYCHKHYK